jgi:hypothetical protein
MLQWLVNFLQGPSSTQYQRSPLHDFILDFECYREPTSSRQMAQKEFRRVQAVRDSSVSGARHD